jgi:hypothetical protein
LTGLPDGSYERLGINRVDDKRYYKFLLQVQMSIDSTGVQVEVLAGGKKLAKGRMLHQLDEVERDAE